jgi:N-acetylated-alpha-linked acidic dipeptidase
MRRTFVPALCAVLALTTRAEEPELSRRDAALMSIPTRDSLLAFHQLLASEPHVAGSAGDARTIERLIAAFKRMDGFEVERHDFWPLLARPVSAVLEIVEPERTSLVLRERALDEDAFSAHPEQMIGWNAYSGSGDVTAGVVYANYGTKGDFEALSKLGIDVRGRIVVCRYGGNFRGYKAKFAQSAGAAGVIIYGDPADRGFVKGAEYPEGPWANSTCIERGSIAALDYPGDPLTPGVEATKDAPRMREEEADLPKIPVQPIGYAAASEILSRMTGSSVGKAGVEEWKGGLPIEYRIDGGAALKVHLKVEQRRAIMATANVIARFRGTEDPESLVIVGCHHDAWNCGAADPLAGTICLLEAARCVSELAKKGIRPRRTLVFAAWGAEEFGIIGSTEWVEGRRGALVKDAIAYINLDMASMGVEFGASGSPSLRRVIEETAGAVPQARGEGTALAAWIARAHDSIDTGSPRIGDIGGGSDHIAFLCHAGIASCGLGAGGAAGNSYHSVYDTLPWYWKAVGEDYEPAKMVTRATGAMVLRLGYDAIVPLAPSRYGTFVQQTLIDLRARAKDVLASERWAEVDRRMRALEDEARAFGTRAREAERLVHAGTQRGNEWRERARRVNQLLLACDRAWLSEEGLPGRPWFKSLCCASDEDSGYAAWALPLLRWSIEHRDPAAASAAIDRYTAILQKLDGIVARIENESTSGSVP